MDGTKAADVQPFEPPETPPDGLEGLTKSQLEHALDGARRGLKVYESLRNLNDVIGAEYGDRVVYELLQNAHDAHDRQRSDGEVTIRLIIRSEDEGELLVANKGWGFRYRDLDAIRNIATSSKEIGEGIGNKGLGFRSVEALTDDVHIYSQAEARPAAAFDGYCFRFAREAEIRARLQRLEPDGRLVDHVVRTIPHYLLPLPPSAHPSEVTALAQAGFATVVRVPLRSSEAVALARSQVQALDRREAPLLLFLRRLQAVTLEVSQPRALGRSRTRVIRRRCEWNAPLPDLPGCEAEAIDLDGAGRFIIIRRTVDKAKLLEAVSRSVALVPQLKRWLDWRGEPEVAVAVSAAGGPIETPKLYNFLAMEDSAVAPFAGFGDAPFFTDIDRRNFKADLPLNAHLIAELAETCVAAALAAVSGNLTLPPEAVVDLLAWTRGQTGPLASALGRRNSNLRMVAAWPTEAGAPAPWTNLLSAVDWSDLKLKVLTAKRVATAGAPVLSMTLGSARIRRIRALAESLGRDLKPATGPLADWVEQLAEAQSISGKKTAKDWPAFYDEVARLYSRLELKLSTLKGRRIMRDGAGRLLEAAGSAHGGASLVYYRPPAMKRGRASPPMPPSSLSRKLRYLAEDAIPSDATLAAMQTADLLRRYDPVEVLTNLPAALGPAPTEIQKRDALIWAFRVSRRGAQGLDEALEAARLAVPALGGWRPARACSFSAAWTPRGQVLEAYLTEAAPLSPDCRRARNDLLAAWADWPRAEADDTLAEWRKFLERLGVRDGLRPLPAKLRSTDTWNNHWRGFLQHGDVQEGFGPEWVKQVAHIYLYYPQTPYGCRGEALRIPGQIEHEQLSAGARERLSDLIVAYLRDAGERDLTFSLGAFHKDRDQDETVLPTPLRVFLQTAAWLAVLRDDEAQFRRPSDCWASRTGRAPPRLIDRYVTELTSGVPPLLFDPRIGLRDWSSPESAAERLASIVAKVDAIAATDRRDFRELYRRLWAELAESGRPLGTGPIVVERSGALESLKGDATRPPTVYIAREGATFAARTLSDCGEPVLDIGAASEEGAVMNLLAATGRFVAKPADAGVVLKVDGAAYAPRPDTPLLVATPGLEWFPDAAALAYLAMGDPLEVRNVSGLVIERRARAIRLQRCARIALAVGDRDVLVGRHERIQAVPHAAWPTLLVEGDDPFDWPLLLEAAPSISKLLGSGVKSFEILLHRLAAGATTLGAPSHERLAAALGRGIEFVREHFDAAQSGVDRLVAACLPVVHYAGGEALVERLKLDVEMQGSRLDLAAWLGANCGGLDGPDILAATSQTQTGLDVQRRLGLDFARFNRSLRALGRPGLNSRADLQRMFEVYLNELRPNLVDRVRRRWIHAYRNHGDITDYPGERTLAFIPFREQWLDEVSVLERDHVAVHAQLQAEASLGPDIALALPTLAEVQAANRKVLARYLPGLLPLVGAWRSRQKITSDDDWALGDTLSIARRLELSGALDFETVGDKDVPGLLAWQRLWPAGAPVGGTRKAFGLSEAELKAEAERAEDDRRRAEVSRRAITFARQELDPEAPNFHAALAAAAQAGLDAHPDWFARSRALRLKEQDVLEPHRGPGGGGGKRGRKQPPESLRQAMGLASEWLAREWLRRRFPKEMTDACWVSSNRFHYCPDDEGDDALGYDFRVVTARNEWLFEVKSAVDAGGEFEFTPNELAVAGSAALERKRRYRVLYVPYVFDPSRWCVLQLGNPASEAWRRRYRIVRRGSTRYAFEVT